MRVPRALAAALLLAGCYKYRPLDSSLPAQGASVQVSLTAEGTEQVIRRYGPNISQLEAKVLGVRQDTLELAVRLARTPEGFESYFSGDTLTLPLSGVSSISGRKLAVGPTVLIGGLVIGGTIGTAAALGSSSSNGAPPGAGVASPQ
jgi:hypothetical protein